MRLWSCVLLTGCGLQLSPSNSDDGKMPVPESCAAWCEKMSGCYGESPSCESRCVDMLSDVTSARTSGLTLERMQCVIDAQTCDEVEGCR